MASAFNAQSDPDVVFKSFSASQREYPKVCVNLQTDVR